MTDDLVKQLWESDEASALTNQAARRIEELEAKLEAVTTVRELMGHMWGLAEDKLQKAIEALERIASGEFSGRMLTSMPPQDAAQYFARTTLAELKGEDRG
jgi:GTPase